MNNSKGRILGYTLVELSISTSIIAMLAVGGLAVLQKKNDAAQTTETYTKLEKIETALKGFIRVKGYIPCPALPASLENATTFGTSVSYNSSTKLCDGSSLAYETGMVPVRTLGLSDDNAYDGWGRKFTYRSTSSSGAASDFGNDNFKGNIAIIDVKGTHKTNINEPAPNNDGAIYVIISSGANGKSAAYRRNDTTVPTGASGIESKNTDHTRSMYIQSEKTNIFDDIVVFGTKAKLSRQNVAESPIRIDDKICDTAQSIANDGRGTLNNYAASNNNAYTAQADTIFKSATVLSSLCKNRKVAETVKPDRIKGLSLWLDAADRGTLFTGSNCLTGGNPTTNTTIGCWKDKSGNSRNATAGTAPTYLTNILNDKPVIRFNGSTTYLNTDLTFLANSNYTIAAVNIRGDSSTFRIFLGSGSGTTNTSLHYGYRSDTDFTLAQWDNDLDITTIPSYVASTPSLSIGSLDTTIGHSLYYFINGTQYSNTNTNMTPLSSVNSGVIGRGPGSGMYYYGDIGEITIYNRTISTLETDGLKEYFSDKWGIKLSSATSTCSAGMVFQKTTDNPQGSCQCPAGKTYVRDLKTANACYQTITSSMLNSCVAVSSAPTYSSPPDKSGMVLWLDANDCTTFTLASGGSNSPVSTWADKSGSGNNATQPTLANMPLYTTKNSSPNSPNGLPVIRFDGVNDKMTVPVNISRSTMPSVTISTVYQMRWPDNNSPSNQALWGQDNGNWDRFGLLVFSPQGLPQSLAQGLSNGVGIQQVSRLSNVDTWQIFTTTLNSNTATSNAWINGQSNLANGFTESVGDAGDSSITLANIGSLGGYPGSVDIAEMMIYNYAISNQQRSTLESYLAKKWAITMLPTDVGSSNLKLWLDAADSSTVYSTSDCSTTLASASGSVGCWKDKSGNNNNATQPTTANQPTYAIGSQNTNPLIKFNSANSNQLITSRMIQDSWTILIASNTSTTGNTGTASQWYNCSGLFDAEVGGAANDFGFSTCSDGSYTVGIGNPDISASSGTGYAGALHITTYRRIATLGNISLYVDGTYTAGNEVLTRTLSQNDPTRITIGSLQTNLNYYKGGIAEIIVYDTHDISPAIRLSMERYLSDKWGGSVP